MARFISNSLYTRRALSNVIDPQKQFINANNTSTSNFTTSTAEKSEPDERMETDVSAQPTKKSEPDKISSAKDKPMLIREILPRSAYLHQEDNLTFVLCKPKLLPLKSYNMEKIEKVQQEFLEKTKQDMLAGNLD